MPLFLVLLYMTFGIGLLGNGSEVPKNNLELSKTFVALSGNETMKMGSITIATLVRKTVLYIVIVPMCS